MNAHPDPLTASPRPPPREAVQRWRLVVARAAGDPDQPQRAQQAAWDTALRACGLPIAGLDADPPKPRYALAAPLSPVIPGEAELVDVWLVERLPGWRVREALDEAIPPGHRLVDVFDVWPGEPALPGQVTASVYRAELDPLALDASALREAAASLLAATALPRSRRKGEASVAYDLRPFVVAVEVLSSGAPPRLAVRMTLRHDPEKGIGRPEELIAELGERAGLALAPVALVRERLVLASERGSPAAREIAARR